MSDTRYVDLSDNVIKLTDKKAERALHRFGGYARKVAQRSLKKARRKRQSELTDYEKKQYAAAVRIAREQGQPRPKPPYKSSEPGELPRWRDVKRFSGKSPLRELIAYGVEGKSVVVGPKLFKSKAQTRGIRALEEGGSVRTPRGIVNIKKRSFMAPAFKTTVDKNILLEGMKG